MSLQNLIPRQSLEQDDEEANLKPVLEIYEADLINQIEQQTKYRNLYIPLDFPCCGDYIIPPIEAIRKKKIQMGKNFMQDKQSKQTHHMNSYDGLFEHNQLEKQTSNYIKRQKIRMIRDNRQEFFQQDGQFVIEKQFYQEQMSRLANISFQQNLAIKTFQKNAILSERNNQKRNTPFQLELFIGCIWFNNHPLQNDEQKKFEQIRPHMRQLAEYSSYPSLPQLARQKQSLQQIKQLMLRNKVPAQQIIEIDDKMQNIAEQYKKQVQRLKNLMNLVVKGWQQIKEIRSRSGIQTVPWKFNVKQYIADDKNNYDIGLTYTDTNEKGNNNPLEQQRRDQIKQERYRVRIYVNDNEVAQSEKVYLQWPSFKALINQKFSIVVYSVPSSIKVQIIKIGFINKIIQTISLAVPGHFAKTITSTEKRFANTIFLTQNQNYSGQIIYKVQWKGQGPKMPPLSSISKVKQQSTEATQEQLDHNELFDAKDPRIISKFKRQLVNDEIIHERQSILPFALVQSTRHILIKLKFNNPEYQSIQVPLLEGTIRKRDQLMRIIQKQKSKNNQAEIRKKVQQYHPLEGIFSDQHQRVLKQIRQIIRRIDILKNPSGYKSLESFKYKITQQIVKQYSRKQEQPFFLVCLKQFCTQRRKLGPQDQVQLEAKSAFQDLDINIHIRSGKNVPIRQEKYELLSKHISGEDQRYEQMNRMKMLMAGNFQAFGNYGNSLYNQQPNIGNPNFFAPDMMLPNMFPPNKVEVNYEQSKIQRVHTIVELKFKQIMRRTQTFQGPYPQWNQTLQFKYNLKDIAMSTQKMVLNHEKAMILQIFDLIQMRRNTRQVKQLRITKSKYYLGRIQIPFSSLVSMPSVTGIFQVDRPLIIYGYGNKKTSLFNNKNEEEQFNRSQYPDIEIQTFLNLDVFTDPLIDPLPAYNTDQKYFIGAETSQLILHKSSDWLQQINTKRYVRLWLNNLENKSLFICRYLSDNISPPQFFSTQELKQQSNRRITKQKLIQRCARFVSIIPKKYQQKILQNTQEFHMTCQQFLNSKIGEDHGILLCNYFNYIDKLYGGHDVESYLIIGKSFPIGKSIFVLRRNKTTNDCQIWNPYNGKCYYYPAKQYDYFCFCFKYERRQAAQQLSRQICPLTQIGCIVSKNNVFINNQDVIKPQQLNFDLQDQSYWKPFLTERTRNQWFDKGEITTIQEDISKQFYPEPIYSNTMQQYSQNLTRYIEQKLSYRRKNRKNSIVAFTFDKDKNLTYKVFKLLDNLHLLREQFRITGRASSLYTDKQRNDYKQAVQKIQQIKRQIKQEVETDKKFYGITLQMTYTTPQQVWQRVAQTQIDLLEVQDIKFVVAVKCYQFACHVISVWIFLGRLEPFNA